MAVVFAKTRKGLEEMETRANGLSQRVRRLLILVDGKRSVDDLRAMVQADDVQPILATLEKGEFIELVASPELPARPASPPPEAIPFQELPADPDLLRLQKARNFMTNTLNAFVGSLGTSSLIERIDRSGSHAELRSLFDEWYDAIRISRDGKREAETLRVKLLEVI